VFTIIPWWPSKAKLHLFAINFLLFKLLPDLMVYDAPPALQPSCTSSLILLLPQTSTVDWLLCLPFKFWPLKAKERPSLYFLTSVVRHHSNMQTNHGATKPGHGCFVQDNGVQRSRELGDPLTFPWRESATLLGGRAAVAYVYVGCCVFCVVAMSGLLATLQTIPTVRSWISNRRKWSTFAHS
jgi:hypothetical protein